MPLTVEYRPYIGLALQGLKICFSLFGSELDLLCWSIYAVLSDCCFPHPAPALGMPLWEQCHTHSPGDCQKNHRLLGVSGCIKETPVDPNNEKKEAPASSIMLLLTQKSSASFWLVTAYTIFCIRKTLNVSLYCTEKH